MKQASIAVRSDQHGFQITFADGEQRALTPEEAETIGRALTLVAEARRHNEQLLELRIVLDVPSARRAGGGW